MVEETTNPSPNELGEMDNTWAIHQLFTTTNFAPKNAIVNWYTGGLNHQSTIFFPNISHVHYGKIAKIVKETAQECNLPYRIQNNAKRGNCSFQTFERIGTKPSNQRIISLSKQ
jgi:linoleoyl-CoA desaturase